MKNLIAVLLSIVIAYLMFFQVDPSVVGWLLSKIPASASEWIGIIEVVFWVVVVLPSIGIVAWLLTIIFAFNSILNHK